VKELERLVEHPRSSPVVELLASHRVLVSEAVASEADAERQPAAAEPVEGRGFPGNLDRTAAGKRGDHWAEPDAVGRGGDRGQRDPRVGHVHDWLGPPKLVPDEESVPSGLLRLG